jgi:Phage integrase, N-terminal SAM-like domain
VGQLLDEWLAAKRAKQETTRALHRSYIETYLRPHLGDVPLDRLTAADVSRMFAWVDERNETIITTASKWCDHEAAAYRVVG